MPKNTLEQAYEDEEFNKTLKDKAYECYIELCPHASKIDTSVEPPQQWPPEKSTTQRGYIEGYKRAIKDLKLLEPVDKNGVD